MADNGTSTAGAPNKGMLYGGWVLTAIPGLMLLASAGGKLSQAPELVKTFEHLGWPATVVTPLGIVEALSALLLLIPQTAVLGAILVTGYMGGAIAAHVRIGEPFFLQLGFGVLAWAGLFLRDARLRELLPLRR